MGRPISALSIVAWPEEPIRRCWDRSCAVALDKMTEASCSIIGGHSVNDPEIKFGYAVTELFIRAHQGQRRSARGDVLC